MLFQSSYGLVLDVRGIYRSRIDCDNYSQVIHKLAFTRGSRIVGDGDSFVEDYKGRFASVNNNYHGRIFFNHSSTGNNFTGVYSVFIPLFLGFKVKSSINVRTWCLQYSSAYFESCTRDITIVKAYHQDVVQLSIS